MSQFLSPEGIRRGIILSDVLLLERPVTLVSKLGTFHATERAFTLLNAMPPGGK
ncbi:MAG TPA: hypothetical protein VFW10_07470 [Steroidobacteraceae bacterium]|nr:hypothetical protein [Steroidobacteraceae bacterium]